MIEEDCWNPNLIQDDYLLDPMDKLGYQHDMFQPIEFGSDNISSCSSSLSSPGDSQSSNLSATCQIQYNIHDDLINQPLADFDDNNDYDQQNNQYYDIKSEYYENNDYIQDDASPSTKYILLKSNNSNESAFRPVATSLSFNRTAMRTVYPVRSQYISTTCQPTTATLSDDEGKLTLPTLNRTRSKMHDLAVKNRLITDQNPKGQGVVQLSAEEKRTLLQEGYKLPTKLPLTREEEESLKLVRRKIKNKLSAQESRRKRKEYMDMLEQKVHIYYTENVNLRQRMKQLEATNADLTKRIQELESRL